MVIGSDLYDITYAVISPKKNCGLPEERDRRYALLTLKQFLRQLRWWTILEMISVCICLRQTFV